MADDGGSDLPKNKLARTLTLGVAHGEVLESEVVPSTLTEIVPILRVANRYEYQHPLIAYLCRKHAYDTASKLDPTSTGSGVAQYMTALHQRLEREKKPEPNEGDALELRNLYERFLQEFQEASDNVATDRARLEGDQATANVLREVLSALPGQRRESFPEVPQIVKPYNILPLDAAGSSQEIMKFDEIKHAVEALRNIGGLPWPKADNRRIDQLDLLDWLQGRFGFQKDNVLNQREHIILLLSNFHEKDSTKGSWHIGIDVLHEKVFANYKAWCKYLNLPEPAGWSPDSGATQQHQLLHVGLYLLICGEAANVRFMPECLCYVYHCMVNELTKYLMLTGNNSGEEQLPSFKPESEDFLEKVITPIYNIIQKEAESNKNGTAPHSSWRNYDDLNEYFWSRKCLELDWPMKTNAEYFIPPSQRASNKKISKGKRIKKTGFVEIRSFWHLFRSFDRLWSFFLLCLQAMIIVACHGSGSPLDMFKVDVLKQISSIFVTASILRFFQGALDVVFNYYLYSGLKQTAILRVFLKLIVAAAWVVILMFFFVHMWDTPTGLVGDLKRGFGGNWTNSYPYTITVGFYILPTLLGVLLFVLPGMREWMDGSQNRVIRFIFWWSQPRLYVGRRIDESTPKMAKYTLFWIILLVAKLCFSYFVEIKPLITPTRAIMKVSKITYTWHEIFPHARKNVGALVSIWAPVIFIYFMDTLIWYTALSSLWGGLSGAFRRLGEIRTLSMLRARFDSLPNSFKLNLLPPSTASSTDEKNPEDMKFAKSPEDMKFAQLWNEVISSLREEDLINNREKDLMLFPYSSVTSITSTQYPPFLLASKIPMAIQMAERSRGEDEGYLWRKIKADVYMKRAVEEGYQAFKYVLRTILNCECGDRSDKGKLTANEGDSTSNDGHLSNDCKVLNDILGNIDDHISKGTLYTYIELRPLPSLSNKFEKILSCLRKPEESEKKDVTRCLQDMYDVWRWDMWKNTGKREYQERTDKEHNNSMQLFSNLTYPPANDTTWSEQIKRFYSLWKEKESAMDVPSNLEARRRITFFTNSLFMKMPEAPTVRKIIPFSVLTPYYNEEVVYRKTKIDDPNEDGITILFYLQTIYPDEWDNFMERMNVKSEEQLVNDKEKLHELRLWASYRGQTLSRTVRGIMYYRRALELQAFLDEAPKKQLEKGYQNINESRDLWEKTQAVADLKFTYVAACQIYGQRKRLGDPQADDILTLMNKYPSLRVAYIDEKEERQNNKIQKIYSSVLVKALNGLDQEVYRIKLPGNPKLGEGKPENQNHAIIFTRGEALQTIDMNQDSYLEEALKMRNLLEEFKGKHGYGARYRIKEIGGHWERTILGLREHIFTGSVSSLAWFMSNQETSFVTIGQRMLADPLKVRFHYGHPDVFDRLFHITRGGISKASKTINLSEDIFAGFNSTLRGGNVTHHEYMQVGKGRDVGLNQISTFEAKVANGNGEQVLSRDVYRLGHRFDFFRMMSCYFTTVGFYFSTMLVVLTAYVFLYGRLYLALSGMERSLLRSAELNNDVALEAALASQSLVQLGALMALPMVVERGLEHGFRSAIGEFILMQLQLASVFFTFTLGTKTHYFGRTILHGGARYRPTGRDFVVRHEKFAENYRLYSRSHFVKGLELALLLTVYNVYGSAGKGGVFYALVSFSMWFLVGTWLFAPFLFNPSGFDWQKIFDDWNDWSRWISERGGIGISSSNSWESWWDEELSYLNFIGVRGRLLEIVLALRFFIYQYGLVYHFRIARMDTNIRVYGISWLVVLGLLFILKIISLGRKHLHQDYQLLFRMLKAFLAIACLSTIITFVAIGDLLPGDMFASILAFIPTGYGILQICLACRPLVVALQSWDSVRDLARTYEILMGLVIFTPIAVLSWFPFISEFQTRLLFNQAFSRGLQISLILAGNKKGE